MRFFLSVLAALGLTSGCGIALGAAKTTLSVLASPSLTEAFEVLGGLYSHDHPAVTVSLTFEGATDIAGQVANRDQADVVAMPELETVCTDVEERNSASTLVTSDMAAVCGEATDLRVIGRATMTIAVAPGNPDNVQGVADLARPRLRVVLAGSDEPEGYDSQSILARAGVSVTPVQEEPDTRTVLSWVRSGQADAGLVYVPDMKWADDAAASVPIPLDENVTTPFQAAALTGGDTGPAAAFVAWLTSPAAQSVLVDDGFEPGAA